MRHGAWAIDGHAMSGMGHAVAFVADNPGDWMLHCHVIDHQAAGMMTLLHVA